MERYRERERGRASGREGDIEMWERVGTERGEREERYGEREIGREGEMEGCRDGEMKR